MWEISTLQRDFYSGSLKHETDVFCRPTHHKCYLGIVHQEVEEVNDERSLKGRERIYKHVHVDVRVLVVELCGNMQTNAGSGQIKIF